MRASEQAEGIGRLAQLVCATSHMDVAPFFQQTASGALIGWRFSSEASLFPRPGAPPAKVPIRYAST